MILPRTTYNVVHNGTTYQVLNNRLEDKALQVTMPNGVGIGMKDAYYATSIPNFTFPTTARAGRGLTSDGNYHFWITFVATSETATVTYLGAINNLSLVGNRLAYAGGRQILGFTLHQKITTEEDGDGDGYRYGFNTQQKQDDIYGAGNHTTALYWEYDTRLGRRWNLDPVTFPFLSRYATLDNNPISKNDVNGDCANCPNPTLNFAIALGTNGITASVNVGVGQNIGKSFTASYSGGLTYYSNFVETGKNGIEIKNSFMMSYKNGQTGASVATNFWNGLGKMKEFKQQTGYASFSSGKFRMSYENDGTPFYSDWLGFGLGDGNDRYRTAAASIGYGDFSLNMNLFTGKRMSKGYKAEQRDNPRIPSPGKYGEFYQNVAVTELGRKYRYGALTISYSGSLNQNNTTEVGINSEWVRHIFQNYIAHNIVQKQGQFPMRSGSVSPAMMQSFKMVFNDQYRTTHWGGVR